MLGSRKKLKPPVERVVSVDDPLQLPLIYTPSQRRGGGRGRRRRRKAEEEEEIDVPR